MHLMTSGHIPLGEVLETYSAHLDASSVLDLLLPLHASWSGLSPGIRSPRPIFASTPQALRNYIIPTIFLD